MTNYTAQELICFSGKNKKGESIYYVDVGMGAWPFCGHCQPNVFMSLRGEVVTKKRKYMDYLVVKYNLDTTDLVNLQRKQ